MTPQTSSSRSPLYRRAVRTFASTTATTAARVSATRAARCPATRLSQVARPHIPPARPAISTSAARLAARRRRRHRHRHLRARRAMATTRALTARWPTPMRATCRAPARRAISGSHIRIRRRLLLLPSRRLPATRRARRSPTTPVRALPHTLTCARATRLIAASTVHHTSLPQPACL